MAKNIHLQQVYETSCELEGSDGRTRGETLCAQLNATNDSAIALILLIWQSE